MNKSMAPFRNKGWVHFDKINEIIPNANARGSYAFSPMNATVTAPGQLRDDEAAAARTVAETASTSSNLNNDFVDLDKDRNSSTQASTTLISTAASKLHKTVPSFNNDDIFNSGPVFPPPPSADAISNPISDPTDPSSISTSGLVRLPPAVAKHSCKTRSTPAESRSGLLAVSAGHSRRTQAKAKTSARRSTNNALNTMGEASSSIIVHNMQGSINMLTATVRDSVAVDPVTKVRQEAVRLLQKEEGLSPKQQIALFQMFADKHALAQTYLAIEAAPLRMGWLQELLKGVEGLEGGDGN
jgi:hypothetical protein